LPPDGTHRNAFPFVRICARPALGITVGPLAADMATIYVLGK